MADKNNLIVYCEYEDGKVADVSLEPSYQRTSPPTNSGSNSRLWLLSDNLKDIEKQILPYGVDTVYKFEDSRLYPYTSLPIHLSSSTFSRRYSRASLSWVRPQSVVTSVRVCRQALHSGLTADCTSLEIGDYTDVKTGKRI